MQATSIALHEPR